MQPLQKVEIVPPPVVAHLALKRAVEDWAVVEQPLTIPPRELDTPQHCNLYDLQHYTKNINRVSVI